MKKYCKADNIIILLHFIATFFWERIIFSFKDNFAVSRLSPINLRFSDRFEIVMAYSISKLIALLLIVCIWKLIFLVCSRKLSASCRIIFSSLFVIGAIVLLFLFPGSFETSGDNYIAYAHAVNFLPDYWFSTYTSCYYAGCMMVLPHPYMIVLVHWLGFVYGMGYAYNRIERSDVCPHWMKYFSFIFLLFPYTHVILMDCYRTELYAVLCMIYSLIVMLDIIERRSRSVKECVVIAFVAGLVSVWRTEGIVLGAISYIALVLLNYRDSFINLAKKILVYFLFVILLVFPQKVGDIKYYGNDYTIINLTRPLGMIFNDPDAILDYDGADRDISAIEDFMPISYLKEFYLDGYRRRNIAIGGRDINQSMSALSYSDAFVKGAYRIILHNPRIYLTTQFNLFNAALGSGLRIEQPGYSGPPTNAPDWDYDMWEVGEEIFYNSPFTREWKDSKFRQSVGKALLETRTAYLRLMAVSKITLGINVFCLVISFVLALYELVRWIVKGRTDAFLFVAIAIAGQFAAIFLSMPAGIEAYLRGIFFTTYAVIIMLPALLLSRKHNS